MKTSSDMTVSLQGKIAFLQFEFNSNKTQIMKFNLILNAVRWFISATRIEMIVVPEVQLNAPQLLMCGV